MKKKGKRGYIINAEGKREYVKKSGYIDLDSFKKGMDFSFTIKLMVIALLVFFILDFIVLDILHSDVLKESVVLEYANLCIVLSQLIGIGTINIYKYIHMKK